jgi:hypothetical protein
MDWGQSFSQGFATGLAIIFANRIVKWIDEHTVIKKIKKMLNDVTKHE